MGDFNLVELIEMIFSLINTISELIVLLGLDM